MTDELEAFRPRGSVSVECTKCHMIGFYDPLAPEIGAVGFVCSSCLNNEITGCMCAACNRKFRIPHLELLAMGRHPRCAECRDIPPMQFASVVYCWCCTGIGTADSVQRVATQLKKYPKHCDCEACWQTWYHVCDEHAASWTQDLPPEEQKRVFRQRGAKITEYPDGSWSLSWPRSADPKDN